MPPGSYRVFRPSPSLSNMETGLLSLLGVSSTGQWQFPLIYLVLAFLQLALVQVPCNV